MGKAKVPAGAARVLIDELIEARRVLARAQARTAELTVSFADTRKAVDRQVINGLRHEGVDARYQAGEFAANEISMACSTSKFAAQRLLAMTRRVRAEAPDAWDAWVAGDIDQDKVERINRALRRLQRDSSKVLLNPWVVDVAVCKSPEILARCLNQFILETETGSAGRTAATLVRGPVRLGAPGSGRDEFPDRGAVRGGRVRD